MVDVLSRMVQNQAQTRIVEGLKVNRNCLILTHLFFSDDSLFFLKANTGNCRRMAECIQRYCIASGQKVNLEKSSIVFSSNTPLEVRNEIKELMGIKATTNPGSYLGVSFLWGKKRREVLNYIVDRVRGKLKSWKQQSLSYGGKEILIKIVASAVPTYLMACFKFPIQICNILNASIANFWRGQKEDEKRIHWKS